MIKAGIIGSTGYAGAELVRILLRHKDVEVVWYGSRSYVDEAYARIYRNFFELVDASCMDDNIEALAGQVDVIFTATPQGYLGGILNDALLEKTRFIDLSADYRIKDVTTYEKWYGITHQSPQLIAQAVYGLPELFRSRIRTASIVGNPGCYTTCSILALYPLLKEGLIGRDGIIIDAKSGVTGAGRKADLAYNLCEASENFKAYGVTTHRHTTEIEEKLGVSLSFTPHLLPVKRGILATVYAECTASDADIQAAYDKYYKDERFVFASPMLPELHHVRGSNCCAIGYKLDPRLKRVILVSVIDNLIKGASGQAIQNMNILFGLDEGLGLPLVGEYL